MFTDRCGRPRYGALAGPPSSAPIARQERQMSNEQNAPKVNPADKPKDEKTQQPPAKDELSKDQLDKTTGGLLPAV
jgi:hypothetical protein